MQTKLIVLLQLIFTAALMNSCSYSFTGSSLSPETETAYIATFPNYAPLFDPDLSQDFTISLINRFDQRTKLSILNQAPADISIEGEINRYEVSPVNIGINADGRENTNQNQLTISVSVRYTNQLDPEKSWTKSYTENETFDATRTLNDVRSEIVPIINERIINSIFNDIVANW